GGGDGWSMGIEPVHAAVPGADPQAAHVVFVDHGTVVRGQARRILGIVMKECELTRLGLEPADAVSAGTDPNGAVRRRQDRQRVVRSTGPAIDASVLWVEAQGFRVRASDPEVPVRVRGQDADVTETVEDLMDPGVRAFVADRETEQAPVARSAERRAASARQRGDVRPGRKALAPYP